MDSLLFDKIQEPYSMDAEQAVLGSILIDSACFDRVSGIIRSSDSFYIPQHKTIYSIIANLKLLNQCIQSFL